MSKIIQIPAKHLATGDTVFFKNLGVRQVLRLYALSSFSASWVFSDGKTRTMPADRLLTVELFEAQPVAGPNEIFRLDLETNRISVMKQDLCNFADEIKQSYLALSWVYTAFADLAARKDIKEGATLFTERAIYWMPKQTAKAGMALRAAA